MFLLVSSVGWFLFIMSLLNFISDMKFLKTALTAQGVVTSKDLVGKGRTLRRVIKFSYIFEDHEYNVTETTDFFRLPKEGELVTIKYNPVNPRFAHIYGIFLLG